MKAILGLVFALAILACVAQASDVVVLTNDNFDEVIGANDFVLVEFFAPWCGHCKKLAPEYELAATALKGVAVLATVDCTAEEALASRFGIQGFPTLKFFKRGGEPIDYTGERNAKGLESWVQGKTEPAVVPIADKAAFDAFLARASLGRVVYFGEDSDLAAAFAKVAEKQTAAEYSFGRVSSADVIAEVGQKAGSVVVFYTHQTPTVYGDAATEEALEAFVVEKASPKLETLVLNQPFITRVTNLKRPMAIFFHSDADGLELARTVANKFAETDENIHFLETSTEAYPALAHQWGASGTRLPTVIFTLWKDDAPSFFAFDEDKEFTVESAAAFITGCASTGVCESYKRSQPIPEPEPEDGSKVVTLVHKNFDQIVKDESKDVLVEFYAPWCGHCKALAPLYEELATAFARVPSVVIAKIDATENYIDPSIAVRGFPTIVLFPGNNKDAPIKFDGQRDFPSLSSFVLDNAHHAVDPALFSGPPTNPDDIEHVTEEKEEL